VGDANVDFWTLAFSAKEAFYKCQYPLSGVFLDFLDVRVRIDVTGSRAGHFVAMPVNEAQLAGQFATQIFGRWMQVGDRLFCGAHLMAV
jgi:4'-phosphopantetheinyl transferase EntD